MTSFVPSGEKPGVDANSMSLTRAECEEFLYEEAAMLDEWRLDDWFALFAEGATYEVPTAGAGDDSNSSTTLFYIADDYFRLGHRVARLKKKEAHAEWPRSIQSHIIGNVRMGIRTSDGQEVSSRFITHRSKNDMTDTYVGHHRYVLRTIEGKIRILSKRTLLAANSLRAQGKVTIIL